MKALIIMLIVLGILAVLILWAALTVPMSEYDRLIDDEAQEEFLRKRRRSEND